MVFPYIETAIAFVLVMLVASLVVNVIVRILHHWSRERAKGVAALLGQLHRGYCAQRGVRPPHPTAARHTFINDILTSPILHGGRYVRETDDDVRRAEAWGAALHEQAGRQESATHAERLRLKADRYLSEVRAERDRTLRSEIDYVDVADVLAVVRSMSRPNDTLPPAWFDGAEVTRVPLDDASKNEPGCYDARRRSGGSMVPSARDFHDHVKRWFATAGATVSQDFAVRARRTGAALSCLVVVVLNLDAIRLSYDLYRDRALTERVVSRVDDISRLAEELPAESDRFDVPTDPAAPDTAKLKLDLQHAASLFSYERVPVGWQDSWIVRRWCAYNGCADTGVTAPTGWQMVREALLWLLGLLASCILVSLGAPFWVNALKSLTGLLNQVQSSKGKADAEQTHAAAEDRWREQLKDADHIQVTRGPAVPAAPDPMSSAPAPERRPPGPPSRDPPPPELPHGGLGPSDPDLESDD